MGSDAGGEMGCRGQQCWRLTGSLLCVNANVCAWECVSMCESRANTVGPTPSSFFLNHWKEFSDVAVKSHAVISL